MIVVPRVAYPFIIVNVRPRILGFVGTKEDVARTESIGDLDIQSKNRGVEIGSLEISRLAVCIQILEGIRLTDLKSDISSANTRLAHIQKARKKDVKRETGAGVTDPREKEVKATMDPSHHPLAKKQRNE